MTPTERTSRHAQCAFTLMELLIVVSVIALLAAILLPAMGRARASARTTVCATHQRQIVTAIAMYTTANADVFPAAYAYKGTTLANGKQWPDTPIAGIEHWSAMLIRDRAATLETFTCPSMAERGLPPANPSPDDRRSGQIYWIARVGDDQAGRCAYTVNEALCPRNRWVEGFDDAITVSRSVRLCVVDGGTILAAEWNADWQRVSRPADGGAISQSHLPVNGFLGLGPMGGADRSDMNRIGTPHPCFGDYRRVTPGDLSCDQNVPGVSRLDWLARHHAIGSATGGAFGFVDGHVEVRSIADTVEPFLWGDRCWSIGESVPMGL